METTSSKTKNQPSQPSTNGGDGSQTTSPSQATTATNQPENASSYQSSHQSKTQSRLELAMIYIPVTWESIAKDFIIPHMNEIQ